MKAFSVLFLFFAAIASSIAPAFGQGSNGALSVSPREQHVVLTTQSKMPHLLALWDIRGMFLYNFVEVQSVTITRFGPECTPHNKLEIRTSRGVENFKEVILGNTIRIVFAEPLQVSRVQEVELGIYSTSNNECPFGFMFELTEVVATTPKGGAAEVLVSPGSGGTVTPSN